MSIDEPYYTSAAPLVPQIRAYSAVRDAALDCRACHLWRLGTQTVFGEGAKKSRIMLVGEQPGDKEDLAGHPFVGPAGRVLDEALEAAGIEREDVYVTNAVKHFKWIPKGARRLHQKPNRGEIEACRPWLEAELELIQPEALVLLGATAAQAVLGPKFKLTQNRGKFIEAAQAKYVLATLHPSAVLRMPDRGARRAALESVVEDLKLVAMQL
ncbi:MAG TPA: UdgX family uracil-DNA binding protein [Fimbriimonas sp.]|nr:UdgX family uracil-DNA binding protein [Fimbriimonas sp.]